MYIFYTFCSIASHGLLFKHPKQSLWGVWHRLWPHMR